MPDEVPPETAGRPPLPVVFVHGIRVSGTMWDPVATRVGSRHRVASPDLPGHGTRRGEPFTMDSAVDAVAAAIDEVGGRALLVAHSLGGFVAFATAGREPEKVAGLVAVGCTIRPVGIGAAVYRQVARVAAANVERANRLSAQGFRRALPAESAEAALAGGLSCEVMPAVVDAVTSQDPLAALARYPGPVWLVNGTRDPFRVDRRRFLAACRDGRLVTVPRRGHISCLAEVGLLTTIVLDAACHT